MIVAALASASGAVVSPLWIALGVVVVLVIAAVLRVALGARRLRRASRAGREASAAAAAAAAAAIPLTTFNRAGHAGDPLNVQIVARGGQIGAAFAAAGWYRADEIDFVTSARISADSVLGRAYSTAPVSNLYLYGRREDLAFERPGSNVRRRDHIRFWNTGGTATDGRPIWIGSGTRDVRVELSKTNHLPTHGISPDIDAERDLVVSDLARTGYVIDEGMRLGFGTATEGKNGGGDPYTTDGQVATLTLADIWTLPFATQVRGPLGARIRGGLERLVRGRLPKIGRERAARAQAKARQRTPAPPGDAA